MDEAYQERALEGAMPHSKFEITGDMSTADRDAAELARLGKKPVLKVTLLEIRSTQSWNGVGTWVLTAYSVTSASCLCLDSAAQL